MTDRPTPPNRSYELQVPPRVSYVPVSHPVVGSVPRVPTAHPAGDGVHAIFFWRVFCRWWSWVVPAGILLSIAAGAVVWWLWVPIYEATALVKIESDAPFIAFDDGSFQRNGDLYVQTQIELLRGPVVLAPVLARPEIASLDEIERQFDPLSFLQEKLLVSQIGQSELYRVSYQSAVPADATTVANVVVAEYLRLQDREETQRSQIVIDVLEKERLERGARVEQLRKRVIGLAKELTGRDPFGQGVVTDVSAFSPAASLYQSLTDADVNLEVLKAELQSLQNAPIVAADKAAASGLYDLEIANRSDVRQLEEQLAEIEDNMVALQHKRRFKIGTTWKKDPEYLHLQDLATAKRQELAELKAVARAEFSQRDRENDTAERARLISDKTQEIAALSAKRQLLEQRFAEHLEDLKSGGAQSAELEFAKAELEREQNVFELIAARKLALQTELRAPARVSLMQPATIPSIPIQLIPYKLMFLACVMALGVPFALAVAHELVVRRVTDAEQLKSELRLPLLGEVARFPVRRVSQPQHASPLGRRRESSVYAESIDSLRTNLLLTENVGVPGQTRVIAVCSAASGEGKTSVATALAMSIAEATKQPTVVLDADLRDPDVNQVFAVPQEPGVAELLSGRSSLAEAVQRVDETQAFVVPAGRCRVNPHHLLQGPAIDNLLQELRENFTTIVIDTPPILSASESLVYAKAADLVVFCSLNEVSRVKQLRSAVERLQATGANLAGAVLSGVSFGRYVAHYGIYDPATEPTRP